MRLVFLAEGLKHQLLHQTKTKTISKSLVVLPNETSTFQKVTAQAASIPEESHTSGSEVQNRCPTAHRQGYLEPGPAELTF